MKLVAMYVTPGPHDQHTVVATVRSHDRLVVYAVDPIAKALRFAKNIDSIGELATAAIESAYGRILPPVDEIPPPKPPIPHGVPGVVMQAVGQFWELYGQTSKSLEGFRGTLDVDAIG